MTEKPLLIGGLAKLTGVKTDTIRFYERIGLLPKPSRTASGYRIYDPASLRRVRFIRKAQALGFRLDEVLRILRLRECGSETCRSVIAIAEVTLTETESKLQELERFRDSLSRNLARWKRAPKGKTTLAEFCTLIESASG
jgi:DNA-binding transcriptional MerR regulator